MTLRKQIIRLLSRNDIVPFTIMEVFLKVENEDDFGNVADELEKLESAGLVEKSIVKHCPHGHNTSMFRWKAVRL